MIEALFDHTARRHRLTEQKISHGERVNRYVPSATLIPGALVPPKNRVSQGDAGTKIIGEMEWYCGADEDLQMNDVLEIVTGPEAPRNILVLSVSHPRGHHIQATCEPFTRALVAAS